MLTSEQLAEIQKRHSMCMLARCNIDVCDTTVLLDDLKTLREWADKVPHEPACASNHFRNEYEKLPGDWPSDWSEHQFIPMVTRVNLGLSCDCVKSQLR